MRRYSARARGEERPDSDVDIMIRSIRRPGSGSMSKLPLRTLSGLFDTRVDVVRRDRLKPHVQPAATRNAIMRSDQTSTRRWLNDIRNPIDLAAISRRRRLRGV